MSFDYIEHKENINIIPTSIPRKKEFYLDLINIENSFTGRLGVMFSNGFFQEATQLIINAITLYEKGYFDCAFYSLRQSLEISTTIVYIVDDDDEVNRDIEINKWKKVEKFPQQGQMLRKLEQRKKEYSELKEKMSLYFKDLEKTKQILNKYVHKQGYDKFYIYRYNQLRVNVKENKMRLDFENSLIKSIGAIAVFRLAIDPLPILLNDENIYNRIEPLLTEPYNDDFITKYIGQNHIKSYKKTKLYKSHYNYFIQLEEMSPAVINLVKYDYYDNKKKNEIMEQKHLLNNNQLVVIELFGFSDKIAFIHCIGGLQMYFSNVKSKRVQMSLDTGVFKDISKSSQKFNINYDEVFLSCFTKENEDYFIEHNEKFSENEINSLDLLAKEE